MSTDKPGRRLCQASNCEWTKQLPLCGCVMHPVSATIIVSCSERFTACDLPDAVGAPVGETLLERSALRKSTVVHRPPVSLSERVRL
jgi:hypothetical protein